MIPETESLRKGNKIRTDRSTIQIDQQEWGTDIDHCWELRWTDIYISGSWVSRYRTHLWITVPGVDRSPNIHHVSFAVRNQLIRVWHVLFCSWSAEYLGHVLAQCAMSFWLTTITQRRLLFKETVRRKRDTRWNTNSRGATMPSWNLQGVHWQVTSVLPCI